MRGASGREFAGLHFAKQTQSGSGFCVRVRRAVFEKIAGEKRRRTTSLMPEWTRKTNKRSAAGLLWVKSAVSSPTDHFRPRLTSRRSLGQFTGDAVMLGPTLYIRFTPKMFMTATWNTQVWGREVGAPFSLNLAEFQRNRAKLKFAVEF